MVDRSLPTLLRLFLREIESPAVEVVPRLSAHRLEGARAFADFGDETPLLLLDDTRDGSGQQGALLTSAAFYFSKPPARVPLEQVRSMPTYPDGPRRPAVVVGADGPVPLPQLTVSAARDALSRAFGAVCGANAVDIGAELPAVPDSDSAVGQLVRAHLVHKDVSFYSELSPLLRRTVVLAMGPLDALDGEQIFAFIDESGGRGTEGVVVTDRRLVYRRKDEHVSLPYGSVEQARAELSATDGVLEVVAGGQPCTLRLARRRKGLLALAAFLDDMARTVAPEWRYAPAAVQRGPTDPSGLLAATTLLAHGDPRARALCELIGAARSAGAMPVDVASDFVHRALLLDHGLTIGRSMHGGWWLSPLQAPDLLFLLRRLLGRPYQEGPSGEGHALAFVFDPRRIEQWFAAIAQTPVGQSVAAVFGAGWQRTRPPAITALRVEVHPFGARGLFGITATTEGQRSALDEVAGSSFAALDHALVALEARLLLVRLLMGPAFGASELWETPATTLQARVAHMGGEPTMVALFDARIPETPGRKDDTGRAGPSWPPPRRPPGS